MKWSFDPHILQQQFWFIKLLSLIFYRSVFCCMFVAFKIRPLIICQLIFAVRFEVFCNPVRLRPGLFNYYRLLLGPIKEYTINAPGFYKTLQKRYRLSTKFVTFVDQLLIYVVNAISPYTRYLWF